MTGQQFATILARNDPFDVAQALERYVRSLRAVQIRDLIGDARSRMTESYRAEFVPLLDISGDEHLKTAFAHALKSNLRAIPLFGSSFCEGVISQIPGDRVVGMGEERRRSPILRPAAIGVIAIALLMAAATIQHLFAVARDTVEAPIVLSTPPPAIAAPPTRAPATRAPARSAPAVHRLIARADVPATAAPQPQPAVVTPPVQAAPVQAAPPVHVVRAVHTLPPGRGVKTVVVQQTPAPSPTPQEVDVSDMPQSYSDATPLPNNQPPPQARVPTAQGVATPTPEPNRSWTHRLVHAAVHLVNSTLGTAGVSKPAHPTPSPSPSGPRP